MRRAHGGRLSLTVAAVVIATAGTVTSTSSVAAAPVRAAPARNGGGSGGGHSSGHVSSGHVSSGGGSSNHGHSFSGGSSGFSSGSGGSRSSGSTSGGSTAAGVVGLIVGFVVLAILVWLVWLAFTRLRRRGRPNGSTSFTASTPAPQMPVPQQLGAGFADVGRARSVAELDQGLAAIRAHDPAFDLDAFRTAAQRTFFVAQRAWTERRPGLSRQVMADSLWQAHKMQIENQLSAGTSNRLDELAVQSITVVGLASGNGYDSVIARIFASSADYTVDAQGRMVRGHTDVQDWCEDWIFQRRAGAATRPDGGLLASQCPHCGAGLQLDAAGVCAYCRVTAVDGTDWVLTRIDQLPSWEWAVAAVPR
jgi:predicted lipid-binding transport protein (Tim44 family)